MHLFHAWRNFKSVLGYMLLGERTIIPVSEICVGDKTEAGVNLIYVTSTLEKAGIIIQQEKKLFAIE